MAKMVERRRIHCPRRHLVAYVIKYDDGSFTVKCGTLKACGDSCPYLKNPDYETPFKRAPAFSEGRNQLGVIIEEGEKVP